MTHIPKIARPADDAVEAAGLTTLEDVAHAGRNDVAALHGMGPKGIRILDEAIDAAGIGTARPARRCVGATPGDLAYHRGRVYH